MLYRKDADLSHREVINSEYNGPFQDWKGIIDPRLGREVFYHHRIPIEVDLFHDDGLKKTSPIKFFGSMPSQRNPETESKQRSKKRIL